MKFKFFPVVITAALTSIGTLFLAGQFDHELPFLQQKQQLPVNYASFSTSDLVKGQPPADFENAAAASVQAVVHIKTQTAGRTVTARFDNDFFGDLFGTRQYYIPPQMGSGSGVVISPDGYIVTNYHVVSNAAKVTVTFNNRYTAVADVVAKDASTDIAVLKVDQKNLPYMEFGNSDDVKLGQWVLAVGYPLTLDATVTAGIVSAKSRAIGINKTASAIESFIQTDAAVNPGNSGGALVNTKGQLVGINSAIASPTGSYAGYSYAIPSNIVQKVVNDLLKYGSFQRAYLGIEYIDPNSLTPQKIEELGIDKNPGVYIAAVRNNGGAAKAGIKAGDFITDINGIGVRTETELQEQVARYRPGDNISVSYLRNGKTYHTTVQLTNINGTTAILEKGQQTAGLLGASFQPLSAADKRKFNIDHGVAVTNINDGIIAQQTNMRKGFVILSVNNYSVNTPEELDQILAKIDGNAQFAGFYPGSNGLYYYGIKLGQDTEEQ
ncbi:MAG TPA: trypsin-like peptidase domain-containing protein [Flavipsychrobacter sp.]|nr:trypsin-like peptidase domain-containing protein [Flavipsychrobacter sp.]